MTSTRRSFLKTAAALPFAGTILAAKAEGLKVSLNAYSFNKLLNDAGKNRGPGVTLMQLVDFCAKCKFDAFDPTAYFFPGYPAVPSNEYIDGLRKKCMENGIGMSGTGVRNNFTTADEAVRKQGVDHIKAFVEVAARLGAPVIRVFADTQMRAQTWQTVSNGATRAQVQTWITACLKECAEHGKKFNVKIGVQNHGDFLATGQQLMDLIKAVDSPFCGPIVDTGYFKSDDPYADMALVAPKAVNWQIKQSPFGEESEVPTDLVKLLKIIRKSGFTGYLPIETLSPRGKPYDPYTVVPEFLQKLRDAIAQTA